MKTTKILILLILLMCSLGSYCKVKYTIVNNGVILIGTKPRATFFNGSGFMKVNTNNNSLIYSLELYSNGNQMQFALKASLVAAINRKYAFAFPSKSKFLLKLKDDSVIELTSILHKNITDPSQANRCFDSYFPLSMEQLNKIFDGVKKIRVEIITLDRKTDKIVTDYVDLDFNKDKIGKQMKEWYDEIIEEYTENSHSLLSNDANIEKKDIKENF
ncbi:hypothetical protein [Phocaeicola coprocola]|uniref:hypothetical protein n=1 Tax=Phocaeicola coprocola TaxID=310298 RepID=UPI0029433AFD|nr:hypothetical protein [Phocaeicola coprocola]